MTQGGQTRFARGAAGGLLLAGAACVFGGLPTGAMAQDAGAQAAGVAESDVILVTARRVQEDLQHVPVAVSVIGGDQIEALDIRSATDLQRVVPSLNVTGDLNRNVEYFTLRGQRETGEFAGAGGGPAVVSYFAEVPGAGNGPGQFLDLASVQVLKGPQGTLFGRNTTGGAVLFEPRRPTDEFEGHLQATVGDFDRFDMEAVINAPVAPGLLSVRLAAQSQALEGFTRDVNTGVDYDDRDNWSARLGLLFTPAPWLENYLIVRGAKYDENGPGMILVASNPAGPFAAAITPFLIAQQDRGVRSTALGVNEDDSGKSWGLVNRTELNLSDSLAVTNIVSWTRNQRNRAADEDGTPLAIADSIGADPGGWFVDTATLTEELQFSGAAFAGALDWRLGGYYEEVSTEGPQTFAQNLQLGFTSHQDQQITETESRALFGQATLHVSDRLNLSAGYRYTWDEGALGLSILGYGGIVTPPPPAPGDGCVSVLGGVYPNCLFTANAKHSGESWLISADYSVTDDLLVYGNVRRGYKSGGYNIVVAIFDGPNNPNFPFAPETVDAIEFGGKWDWRLGGMPGRTNVALYESSYDDVQVFVNVVIPPFTTRVVQNAAEATIRGLEIEGEIRPMEQLSLSYGYAYTDAAYDRYMTPTGEDRSGLPFLYTPEQQFSLGFALDLPIDLGTGELALSGAYSWQDDVFAGFADASAPFTTIESYDLSNLRLEWNNIGEHVDAALFVNNVADVEYRVANYQQYDGIGTVVSLYGPPRMWGVTLRGRF